MHIPTALQLKYPGTNCDQETKRALEFVGFEVQTLPIANAEPKHLAKIQALIIPGGFSYGDDLQAGRIAKIETQKKLGDALHEFHQRGGYILGICNGFQTLTQLDLLPPSRLAKNKNSSFICRWATLDKSATPSPYLHSLPDTFELPVAHAEGRFITPADSLESLKKGGHIALHYRESFNGSQGHVAALQDETRRILGIMPHPERFLWPNRHYDADWEPSRKYGWGYEVFKSLYTCCL